MLSRFSFFAILFWAFSALAVDVSLPDAAMEARAQSVFREIRCMVCTTESIADSPVEVASAMRATIRVQIAAGVSDDEIKAMLARQYGDVILMNPPFKNSTIALWVGPWLVLFMGMVSAYFYFRNAKKKTL